MLLLFALQHAARGISPSGRPSSLWPCCVVGAVVHGIFSAAQVTKRPSEGRGGPPTRVTHTRVPLALVIEIVLPYRVLLRTNGSAPLRCAAASDLEEARGGSGPP